MGNLSSHLDHVFGALADPTRRAILVRLGEGEASVGELARPFDMALPSLMKHIRVLEVGGLVESQKSGRVRTCRLKPAAMTHAESWLIEQRAVWEARLDRLEAYVNTIEKNPRKRGREVRPVQSVRATPVAKKSEQSRRRPPPARPKQRNRP